MVLIPQQPTRNTRNLVKQIEEKHSRLAKLSPQNSLLMSTWIALPDVAEAGCQKRKNKQNIPLTNPTNQ
jgi:hypothetical protein